MGWASKGMVLPVPDVEKIEALKRAREWRESGERREILLEHGYRVDTPYGVVLFESKEKALKTAQIICTLLDMMAEFSPFTPDKMAGIVEFQGRECEKFIFKNGW